MSNTALTTIRQAVEDPSVTLEEMTEAFSCYAGAGAPLGMPPADIVAAMNALAPDKVQRKILIDLAVLGCNNANPNTQSSFETIASMLREPLRISLRRYWQDIETCVNSDEIPPALGDTLKGVVNAVIHSTTPPQANTTEIRLAKQYFRFCGIVLIDEGAAQEFLYDIMVVTPENPSTGRTFFHLVRRFPHSTLKRLSEV